MSGTETDDDGWSARLVAVAEQRRRVAKARSAPGDMFELGMWIYERRAAAAFLGILPSMLDRVPESDLTFMSLDRRRMYAEPNLARYRCGLPGPKARE